MKIQELALKATESMISNGYKPITAWYTYENVLKNVVIEHERQNTDEYSEKAVSTYSAHIVLSFDKITIVIFLSNTFGL